MAMNSDFLQSAGCCDNHQVSKFLFTTQKQVDPFHSFRSAHPKDRHAFINLLRPWLSHAVLTEQITNTCTWARPRHLSQLQRRSSLITKRKDLEASFLQDLRGKPHYRPHLMPSSPVIFLTLPLIIKQHDSGPPGGVMGQRITGTFFYLTVFTSFHNLAPSDPDQPTESQSALKVLRHMYPLRRYIWTLKIMPKLSAELQKQKHPEADLVGLYIYYPLLQCPC